MDGNKKRIVINVSVALNLRCWWHKVQNGEQPKMIILTQQLRSVE